MIVPAAEGLDQQLSDALELIAIEHYYFGYGYWVYTSSGRSRSVLLQLKQWKKGEPKEWPDRALKPYFTKYTAH